MIVASIDIGTNTVILLIAEIRERNIIPLYNEQRIPRIGRGLSRGKLIAGEKKEILMEILSGYRKKMDEFNCGRNIAVATNAFRTAGNGEEIAQEIRMKFNLDIKIVSGEEEARLSYLGAVSGINKKRKIAVMDVGGGSTELIFGEGNKIDYKKSFPAGVVSLTEKYFKNDPPSGKEIKKLETELDYIFSEIVIERFYPETAIAIAGTPTTLACIQKKLPEFDEEAIEGSLLHRNDLENLIYELRSLKKNEILGKYEPVVKGREDVLLSGTIILNKIMAALNLDRVMVSTKGIRYGAILEYLIKD